MVDRSKTVTRRLGWRFLKPGDRLTLCRKVMGRRKGEPLVREYLAHISWADVVAEGFGPNSDRPMTPGEFFSFFAVTHKGCTADTIVTRIEWRYLEVPACICPAVVAEDGSHLIICPDAAAQLAETHAPASEPEPDPQLTIHDYLDTEATPHG